MKIFMFILGTVILGPLITTSTHSEESQILPAIVVTPAVIDGVSFPRQTINIKFKNLNNFSVYCNRIVLNVDYYDGNPSTSFKAGEAPLYFQNVIIAAGAFSPLKDGSQEVRDYIGGLLPNYQIGNVQLDKSATSCEPASLNACEHFLKPGYFSVTTLGPLMGQAPKIGKFYIKGLSKCSEGFCVDGSVDYGGRDSFNIVMGSFKGNTFRLNRFISTEDNRQLNWIGTCNDEGLAGYWEYDEPMMDDSPDYRLSRREFRRLKITR